MVSHVILVIAGWIDSARMQRLWSRVECVAFALVPLTARNVLYTVLCDVATRSAGNARNSFHARSIIEGVAMAHNVSSI